MNINKTLEYTIYAGLFALLFVPLIVSSNMFFPFITGKNFTFRIITEIVFGLWAILAVRAPEFRLKKSKILYALASFVGIMFLATIFSENTFKSFWSNFERSEGWITLLHLLGMFIVVSSMFVKEQVWTYFFGTSIGVSIYLSIVGIRQVLGQVAISQSDTRIDTTFGNSAYFAIYMVFNIFLLLFFWFKRQQKNKELFRPFWGDWVSWGYLTILLLQLFALYRTATRGAILGILGGIFLAAILIAFFEKEHTWIRKTAMTGVGIVVIVILLFFGFKEAAFVQNSPVLNRFANISFEEASSSRFPIWNMAWQGFKEKPILGWGQESFSYVFNKYYDPAMYAQEQWFDRAHNVVLDWLTAGGILGFLSYHALFIFALYYLWKKREGADNGFSVTEKALITGLLAAYYFHNLFVFDNIVSYIYFMIILAFIHSRAARNDDTDAKPASSMQTQLVVAPIALLGIVLMIIFFNGRGIAQANTMIDSLKDLRLGNYPSAVENFEKAYEYPYGGRQEVAEQLVQAAVGVSAVQDQSLRELYLVSADEMLNKELTRDPNNARLHVFATSLYNRYGVFEKSEESALRAKELSPYKQTIRFELANVYLSTGRYQEAYDLLKETYELDQRFTTAAILYAVGAIYIGEPEFAEELMLEHFGKRLVLDDMVLRAFVDTGDFNKALQIVDARIAEQPNNHNYYLSRASILLELNRRQEAIASIEQAMAINPDPAFLEQGNYFISEIKAGRNP